MSLVNILEDQNDSFARYKMPEFEIRTKNKITYVMNLINVSKALKINPLYIVKYIGQSVSTKSRYDEKTNEWQLNGIHDKRILMINLRKFIKECILCSKCGLPELDYKIVKNVLLYQICRACSCSYKCPFNGIFKYIHQIESQLNDKDNKINKEIELLDDIESIANKIDSFDEW